MTNHFEIAQFTDHATRVCAWSTEHQAYVFFALPPGPSIKEEIIKELKNDEQILGKCRDKGAIEETWERVFKSQFQSRRRQPGERTMIEGAPTESIEKVRPKSVVILKVRKRKAAPSGSPSIILKRRIPEVKTVKLLVPIKK